MFQPHPPAGLVEMLPGNREVAEISHGCAIGFVFWHSFGSKAIHLQLEVRLKFLGEIGWGPAPATEHEVSPPSRAFRDRECAPWRALPCAIVSVPPGGPVGPLL